MPLFCYVHRKGGAVAYFEVFPELTPEAARIRANEMLLERSDGLWAEIWDEVRLIDAIEREPSSAL